MPCQIKGTPAIWALLEPAPILLVTAASEKSKALIISAHVEKALVWVKVRCATATS